jgi:hypothetical protein
VLAGLDTFDAGGPVAFALAMAELGFVKFYRELFSKRVWRLSDAQFRVWFWLVMHANWKPERWICSSCKAAIMLPIGGFAFPQGHIAAKCGVSRKVVRGCLDHLIGFGSIRATGRAHCHASYVFDRYREILDDQGDGARGRDMAGTWQGHGRDMGGPTKEEVEEVKEERRRESSPLVKLADLHRNLYLSYHRRTGGADPAKVGNDAAWSLAREMRWLGSYQAIANGGSGSPLTYEEQAHYLALAYKSERTWGEGQSWARYLSGRSPAESWRRKAQTIADQMDNDRRTPRESTIDEGERAVAETRALLREMRGK